MIARSLCLVVLLAALTSRPDVARAGDMPATLLVGGVLRTYLVHVPEQLPANAPLVLAFHGHFGTGAGMARLTRFDAIADADRFVVAYPDGLAGNWNDGRPESAGADDVAFVRALVADLAGRYALDPKRVYATGFSNGASFSEFLGCRLADVLAAIAPVSGYLPAADTGSCRPARSPSVLIIGGDADPVEPYAGGRIMLGNLDRGAVLSAAQSAAFWAHAAGCVGSPAVDAGATIYTACAAGRTVELVTVPGGGHAWPGGPQYLPQGIIGTADRKLDASAEIARFFLAHPAP